MAEPRTESAHGPACCNHHPSCCGACDVCVSICWGYHGPERRAERPDDHAAEQARAALLDEMEAAVRDLTGIARVNEYRARVLALIQQHREKAP